MTHLLHRLTSFILIAMLVIGISSLTYIYNLIQTLPELTFPALLTDTPSYIMDYRGHTVLTLNQQEKKFITYNELSDHFINALVSVEDERFYVHEGVDIQRLVGSIWNNITNGSLKEGASTLSQQLIKNTIVGDEHSLERKIKEASLAYQLEQTYSKEEIITAYSNYIYFDGITPGINSASLRFFGKEISDVTLPEAALLAALVKSPSQYSPIYHPEEAYERKNLVLDLMFSNDYISDYQRDLAKQLTIDDLIVDSTTLTLTTYPYQAYIDIVYEEVFDLTGLDPYSTPMRIHTYLNKELQHQLDRIQSGEEPTLVFQDDIQQMAATVIDNSTGAIVGVIGGRHYDGQRLFNRSYHMRKQPASTIKPILSYALAMDHLGWTNVHVVKDIPYSYPGTSISVDNVDYRYLGDITLEEALGYSRNTSALMTLEQVRNTIGMENISNYLSTIELLDVESSQVTMSYGLGAWTHGVSTTQMAAAYSMLPNLGVYRHPTTIQSIELLDGSNRVITPQIDRIQALTPETAYKLTSVMEQVVQKNYWNIGSIKIPNVAIAAKTGTSSFSDEQRELYGYPSSASKDLWITGYTPDYSLAIWTGFDTLSATEKTYFSQNDPRTPILKQTFKAILQLLVEPELKFEKPINLQAVPIVLGTYPYLLPDEYTPDSLIGVGYFLINEIPTQTIFPPPLPDMGPIQATLIDQELTIELPALTPLLNEKTYGKTIFSIEKMYGSIHYVVELTHQGTTTTYTLSEPTLILPLEEGGTYEIKAYYQYELVPTAKGKESYHSIDYVPNFFDWLFG